MFKPEYINSEYYYFDEPKILEEYYLIAVLEFQLVETYVQNLTLIVVYRGDTGITSHSQFRRLLLSDKRYKDSYMDF